MQAHRSGASRVRQMASLNSIRKDPEVCLEMGQIVVI